MKRNYSWIVLICLAIFSLALLPACTPVEDAGASMPPEDAAEIDLPPEGNEAETEIDKTEPSPADTPPGNTETTPPDGMVAFDGEVFVASTEVVTSRWQSAGWRIGDQALDTESQDVPPDCTLYPHAGVDNQWIGSCRGYVLVPQDGASHIDVILTHPDGSTTLIQVAPPSDSS